MLKLNTTELEFKGTTQDIVHRTVRVYVDDENMYAVYFKDTPEEYYTSVKITDVTSNLDCYLFTPYIEFVDFI